MSTRTASLPSIGIYTSFWLPSPPNQAGLEQGFYRMEQYAVVPTKLNWQPRLDWGRGGQEENGGPTCVDTNASESGNDSRQY